MAHLWTPSSKKAALSPDLSSEYISKQMCKMYSCTPSQLDKEDWERVLTHWEMETAERLVKHERDRANAEKQRKANAKAKAKNRAASMRSRLRR